jgi:hypothetical protein
MRSVKERDTGAGILFSDKRAKEGFMWTSFCCASSKGRLFGEPPQTCIDYGEIIPTRMYGCQWGIYFYSEISDGKESRRAGFRAAAFALEQASEPPMEASYL